VCGMRPLQVVELLPDRQLGTQVDVARVVEQLVELELIGEVRSFDLAVQVRTRRLDVDVVHAEVFSVPVELGLPLVPVVGPDRVDAEGEALDHVVEEVDGALLVVALVDAQGAARILVASSIAVNW